LKITLGLLGILFVIFALFAISLAAFPRYFGAFDLADVHKSIDVIVLALATFGGVVSNSIYDRITGDKESRNLFRKRDVVLASVVAPIVMLPIYQTLQANSDVVVLALTAYQNGFFFNTWFSKLVEKKK
jgi:hypothetical protein